MLAGWQGYTPAGWPTFNLCPCGKPLFRNIAPQLTRNICILIFTICLEIGLVWNGIF